MESSLNVIYWMRIAAGIAAGLISGALQGALPQPVGALIIIVAVFIATIIIAKFLITGKSSKIYYHGIGGYIIWWFVSYAIYISLEAAGVIGR
jgi:hypothetical protein